MNIYTVLNIYAFIGILVLLMYVKQLITMKFIPYLRALIQARFKS
jgi:hypothetical protein